MDSVVRSNDLLCNDVVTLRFIDMTIFLLHLHIQLNSTTYIINHSAKAKFMLVCIKLAYAASTALRFSTIFFCNSVSVFSDRAISSI